MERFLGETVMRYVAFLCGLVLILACNARAQVNPANAFLLGAPSPAWANAAPALSAPDPAPQGVYGVLQTYNWQAYAGYTFLRFYEIPNVTSDMNGFNFSVVYFPHGGKIGVDGEFAAAFATQAGVNTKYALGMGGARYRLPSTRELGLWIHGLAGGSRFLPQTEFGSTDAFGYEVGGGIDLMPRGKRLGYRVQADMVGTRFFGTHQYSPKISFGLVYNL